MGSGNYGLYSGTKGSSKRTNITTKPQKEKNKKTAEKRKLTISKKVEAVKSLFENGKIQLNRVKANPKCLEKVTPNQWKNILTDLGYRDVSVAKSTQSSSGAIIVKIGNQGSGNNISQVQISPGGGRHGELPYIKISTTDLGKIKVVFGKKSQYKHEGNERATIIFTEE